jgi:hypothetical protein
MPRRFDFQAIGPSSQYGFDPITIDRLSSTGCAGSSSRIRPIRYLPDRPLVADISVSKG